MKNFRNTVILLLVLLPNFASAFPADIRDGFVTRIWPGTDRMVIEMQTAKKEPIFGVCGSGFFELLRTNKFYNDFYSAALTAMNARNIMNLWVTDCNGNRNIVNGGSIIRP